ncbi:kunitz-type serine protease inhibitor A isoform X4 [Rhipicephalus sanguineus]|uniref:kunitz-type serine protease inhibitor A isoform X4 n=1 Tax=Rhipicephalus sanguineus TaxID=34632 RepID=UPI001893F5A7|nr:kunitz-type serine protease inhibitor A isoform X4 [Rhipicephalus sanguineus]
MRSLYNSCLLLVLSICGVNGFQVLGKLTRKPPRRFPLCCLKPPFNAACQPITSTWYFDQKARVCRQISPGMCNRGSNSFASHVKCMEACKPRMKPKPLCSADPEPDQCMLKRRYVFFDFRRDVCLEFPKKRCGKGHNSFASFQQCFNTCSYNLSTMPCPTCEQKQQHVQPPNGKPGPPRLPAPLVSHSPPG